MTRQLTRIACPLRSCWLYCVKITLLDAHVNSCMVKQIRDVQLGIGSIKFAQSEKIFRR